MAISPLHTPGVQGKPQAETPVRIYKHEQQQAALNVSILESTEVTLAVKGEPMALLFRTAIEKLNEFLAPELGEDAIHTAAESGLNVSPEATANRIVELSTGFYDAFKAQHEGEDEAGVFNNFMETIGKGIEQGFAEAREILEGLQVLEGEIATNIDHTYDLVQKGLAAFREQVGFAEIEPENAENAA